MTFKLPKEKKEKLYVAYNFSQHPDGALSVFSFDPEEFSGNDWITVAVKDVTIKIPEVDLIPKMVNKLKEAIDKEKAEHSVTLDFFQDKINSLLAIEYKGDVL